MEDKKNMTPEEMDNQEEMTVTLTLDDGKELECVVLNIFTATQKMRTASRIWKTLKTTMSMRSLPMPSMNC